MSSMPPWRSNPVWRTAPTVLLRFRSLFAALAVGTFLVTVVAAAYPLFLSASENELLASAIDDATVTPYGMGIAYRSTEVGLSERAPDGEGLLWERRGDAFASVASGSDSLGPTELAIFGGVVSVTDLGGAPPPSGTVEGRLFAGTDAIAHVDVIAGDEGPGVWLPDLVATPLAAEPGDEVVLHSGAQRERVLVDGVYASLYTQPRQGYWRLWNDDIYPCPDVLCSAPPQFILAEPEQLLDLSAALGVPRATFAWQAPAITDPPMTLEAASDLGAFSGHFLDRAGPGGDLFEVLSCCGRRFSRHGASEVTITQNAGLVVHEVRQRSAAVQGPMLVLVVAGLAIALSVVAAAAVFSVVGRRVEVGVLTIRGWGPGGFGAKASLEALLPAAIGGVLGWAAATSLIAWAGPAAPASVTARATSIVAALAGTLASIAIVGVVSGVAFVARHEHRHRFTRIVAAVPWEIAVFAIAWMLAGRLEEGGVVESGGIERPEPAVFLLPLMVALGAGILAARVTGFVVRRAARSGGSRVTASWLAIRRLRAGPALTSLFVVAGILTLAVSSAALATVASLRATVEAKARIFVGSEVQVQVASDAVPAPGFPYPTTRVTRFRDAGSIDGGEASYDLLVIEPDDFASAAYWNDAFSADPLPALLERLTAPMGDGVPIVVANGGGATPETVSIGQEDVPVTVVGTAVTFPGTSSDSRPLVVMDAAALARAFRGRPDPLATPRATTELWVDGPAADVQQRIDELGVLPQLVLSAEEVEDIPFIAAAVQTFLVLQVLALSAVALVVVVGVVYLHAKQRSRVVATTLSDRMGMPLHMMRTASIAELGAMLLVSFLVGTIVGVLSASIVVPSIDPLPTIPPAPLIVTPIVALVVTAVCLMVASVVGGAIADRGARHRSTAEVMRVAE
jgi:putative ABC transport system permease protein